MRTLIRNGTVVTAQAATLADVLIEDGVIKQIGPWDGVDIEVVIDASAKYVLPGGVDVHTHLDMPFAGTVTRDDFETGTRAAACGGTTTIVDFAIQSRGRSLREGLEIWHEKARGKSAIDYGFHLIMSDVNASTLKEMAAVIDEGVTSFKLFTAYPGVFYSDDAAVFRTLVQSRTNGGLTMIHAENGMAIDVIAEAAVASGNTEPWFHGTTRPARLEAEATNRVIKLAEVADAPIYIVHLSTTGALDAVRASRDCGSHTYAETCPHYLFLTADSLGNGWEGAKYVCSPPLRDTRDQEALWNGLQNGDLQVISSDHCAFDFDGQKSMGREDFRKIPNGVPDIEHRLDLLHSGGVVTGRLSLERWVEIVATEPAKLFGLFPKKGTILPGSDADLVIYDPDKRHTLGRQSQQAAVDYNLYEGTQVQGSPSVVLSRGRVIVENGRYVGSSGWGRYVKRLPVDYSRV